ncbi:putative transmembrane protein 244 isoform X2 [Antedon mediterranea]|uniref:putative transmembrane protein 244 isoform X2 n=1 Tax=Antedon mediterranea TaxID=105859 RepID=UPI003AF9211B
MLDSIDVVINIVFCQLSFYGLFYMVASLMHGIFVLDDFDGKIPFHVDSFQSMFSNATTTWNQPIFLADLLSLECTCLISPLAFIVFLYERIWDFAVTTILLHVLIVCIVNLSIPTVWEWWVSILIGLVSMIFIGEALNACFHRKSSNKEQNKEK